MNKKALIASVIFISGCADSVWVNYQGEQASSQEVQACKSQSFSAAPINTNQDYGSTTHYNGTAQTSAGQRYSYSGTAYTQPNYAANMANSMGNIVAIAAASNLNEGCMRSNGFYKKGEGGYLRTNGPAHLVPPSNSISTSEMKSEMKEVITSEDSLPISVYEKQTSASPEVYKIEKETIISVISETEGMYKVSIGNGVIGWVGKSFVKNPPKQIKTKQLGL